jgi:hypothetical protein
MPSAGFRIEKPGRVMDQQIHFLDANHQPTHGIAPDSSDNAGLSRRPADKPRRPDDAQIAAMESSAFAFVTGVLLSGSLVAAVGTLITALTRVPG